MQVFRICRPQYAYDLSGLGAKRFGGRWNPIGTPVLYASENSSLAMLEILAHTQPSFLKSKFSLVTLGIPDAFKSEILDESKLDADWAHPTKMEATRDLGLDWVHRDGFQLKVPSAVNPYAFNYLLNPLHSHFEKVRIDDTKDFYFDLRLTQGS